MSWAAEARGDLNGDGVGFSEFAGVGGVENGFAKIATTLLEANPDEREAGALPACGVC